MFRQARGAVVLGAWIVAACSSSGTPAGAVPLAGSGPGSSGSQAVSAAGAAGAVSSAAGSSAAGSGTASGAAGAAAGGGGSSGAAVAGSGGMVAAGAAAGSGGMVAAGASGSAAGAAGMAQPAGPPEGCPATPLAAGDHTYMIDSKNGQKYSYIISVPKTVDSNVRSPVVVHWHALSSDPEEARSLTSVDAKAEAAKVIVVYPRSPDKSWDLGSCCTGIVNGKTRDEEVFVRELVADMQTKACMDPKRIYTNGFSNGGMMSQMIACKVNDLFAAAAPMGSTLTIPKAECTPKRAVPIFLINGTEDPLVGYSAAGLAGGISATDDVQFWVDKDMCTGTPETFLMKGKATCKRYAQCGAGTEVSSCAVEGMGHCVPGMKKESPTNCLTKSASGLPIQLGPPNDDIDAVQMAFDFLLKYTLP